MLGDISFQKQEAAVRLGATSHNSGLEVGAVGVRGTDHWFRLPDHLGKHGDEWIMFLFTVFVERLDAWTRLSRPRVSPQNQKNALLQTDAGAIQGDGSLQPTAPHVADGVTGIMIRTSQNACWRFLTSLGLIFPRRSFSTTSVPEEFRRQIEPSDGSRLIVRPPPGVGRGRVVTQVAARGACPRFPQVLPAEETPLVVLMGVCPQKATRSRPELLPHLLVSVGLNSRCVVDHQRPDDRHICVPVDHSSCVLTSRQLATMTSGLLRPCQGISVLRDRGVVQTSMSGRHAVISWVMSDRSRQPQTDRLHYHLDRWKVDAPRTSLHRSALGNHEFDNGVDGLMKPFMQKIQCPVLSANIKPDKTLAPTFGTSYLPYKILTVGDQKVGVVGYTSRETSDLSRPGTHLRFEDEVNALQPHVDKLQTLGVNKIIALGHSGFTMDREIAKKVRGVDVVIGGHTNTFLYTGTPPSSEVPAGPYPFMVDSDDGRQVPVVQAYAFGKYLGYLKVTFDEAGNVVRAAGNPILLNSSVPQDPDVLAEVEEWKKNLANYSAHAVGRTLVFLNGETEECRFRECNLGNMICDAMLNNYIRFPDGVEWNHVSACIYNGGGVRASIDEHTRNGSITMEDLISVLPFGGTFDLVQLRGSTLRKAFEHGVRRHGQSTGEFLQVSGFQVELDLTEPAGRRVKSLSILCTKCRVPHYEPVQDESVYKVVLPSYMVTGGDGFSMIKSEMLKHNSGDLDISVMSEYIAQRKKVYPSVEGRIKIYSSASGPQGRTAALVLLPLTLLWTV
ncbi:putative 5'-nucleotidase-like isoform 2 [Scophthalmus maximus]|uniref:5'-nucleotidase n=1 Tax=Scophthalmus maximus TaxID=52904 RepID=A0A2U9CX50_SCOMX|nr:putative 5'-nucleotidase-like isoform 2 [Scophthalmus maximus]